MSIRQNDFAHTFGPLFLYATAAELQVGSGRHATFVTEYSEENHSEMVKT